MPEGLIELGEVFFGQNLPFFGEGPYHEVERHHILAEKFMEMGLFRESEKELNRAERALLVAWGVERGKYGLKRYLPTPEEFRGLTSQQQKTYQEYLRQRLKHNFLKEEFYFLVGEEDKLNLQQKECRRIYRESIAYLPSIEQEYAGLVSLMDASMALSLTPPKNKGEDFADRLYRRRLIRLFLQRGDISSAYLVFQDYAKIWARDIHPLALARYYVLFGSWYKALKLVSQPVKDYADLAEFYVYYEMEFLAIRLLLSLGKAQEAKERFDLLWGRIENYFQKKNIPGEVRASFLLNQARLGRELAMVLSDPEAKALSQRQLSYLAFSEAIEDLKTKELENAKAELSLFWKFDKSCFSEKEVSKTFLPDWSFSLVFQERPSCPWFLFEQRLLMKRKSLGVPHVMELLDFRYALEKNALSLPLDESNPLYFFTKYYLLREKVRFSDFSFTSYECREPCLSVYESPFYVYMQFLEEEQLFEKRPGVLENKLIFDKWKRLFVGMDTLRLNLFGEAHQRNWEKYLPESSLVMMRQIRRVRSCALCNTQSYHGIGISASRGFLKKQEEKLEDIFSAFPAHTLLSPSHPDIMEEIMAKGKQQMLMFFLQGSWVNDEKDLILKVSGQEVFRAQEIRLAPNIEGMVFDEEQAPFLYEPLFRLAESTGMKFLILPEAAYPEQFYVSFFYDLFFRMSRKKIPFVSAFKESRERWRKTVATSDAFPAFVIYAH